MLAIWMTAAKDHTGAERWFLFGQTSRDYAFLAEHESSNQIIGLCQLRGWRVFQVESSAFAVITYAGSPAIVRWC